MINKSISKMTRTLIPLLFLAIVFTMSISAVSAAPGDTMYVNDTGGDDNNDGSSWETAKKTILNATENVNTNGIVNIANGQYSGVKNTEITITKSMTINGESQTSTIINGTGNNWIFYINPGINVTINNLTLTNGTTEDGGAISNHGNLTVSNCSFTKNNANVEGGGIYSGGPNSIVTVTGCTFTNNTANNGGAIDSHGIVTVMDCSFTNNTANRGAAIYTNQATLTVTSSIFNNNTANSYGGAISNMDSILTVTGSTFTNNTANNGGAIYNTNEGTVTITGSTFTNNTAQGTGENRAGAICNYGIMTVTGSTFTGNTATIGGGAILAQYGTLCVINSEFSDNIALGGGAILAQYGTLCVINSEFIHNGANYGGAICNDEGNFTLSGSNFINNVADSGAVLNTGNFTLSGSNFINNFAINGGAIFNIENGIVTVTGSNFINNMALLGGAIYNNATSTVNGSNFINNTASYGGAIFNIENGIVTVTGSNFINNTATNLGGAIYNNATSTVHFCRIIGNTPSDISHDSGSCDAEYNWWGTNFEGTDPVTAGRINTAVSKWLVLTITADPTTINNEDTSAITADLLHDQNGAYYDPLLGHVPDGITVTFTTDLGSIGSKTINKATSGGIATATLTADETPGIAHLTATSDSQTVNTDVTINPKSSLYLTVTPNKTNPVVGDTVIYTLKVGNKGPDAATDVVMTYVVPEGLEFAGANVDNGTYTYDPVTRTITWTIGNVPVGDPYMWLSLRILRAGTYLFNPQLSTSTNDPTLNTDTQSITIHAAAVSNTANAASIVSMQNTGVPIVALILALFLVIGGMVSSKK